jgi:hypothetical protein
MKKLISSILFVLCIALTAQAQFFYNEIMTLDQASRECKDFIKRNIRKVSVKSFEDDGSMSKRFFCEKKFSKDFKEYKLYTRTGVGYKSLMTGNFDENQMLLKTVDSSEILVKTCFINYDESKRLSKTKTISRSKDDDFIVELTEEHVYLFENEKSIYPSGMWKIMQGKDSTFILFQLDEKGNLAIEKNGKTGAKYYYYYDSNNKLTDVVHQSEFKTDFVPDYIFEYDQQGQLSRMNTFGSTIDRNIYWLYDYKDGLKVLELIKSGKGERLGRFEYEYE